MQKSQNFGRGRNMLMLENIDLSAVNKQEELKRQYQRELLEQIELNRNIRLAEQRRKKLEEQEEERRILAEMERERHKENFGRTGNQRSVIPPPLESPYDIPVKKTHMEPKPLSDVFAPMDVPPKINTKVSLKYLRSSKDFDANYETRHTSFGERRSEQLMEPPVQYTPPVMAPVERETGPEDRGEFFKRRKYFSRASNVLNPYRNMAFENNLNELRKLNNQEHRLFSQRPPQSNPRIQVPH